jgi:3',5'-cyclic AMP phosphodiesterase CpdA
MSSAGKQSFLIAQVSDLHCGGPRFDTALIDRAIAEVNDLRPDLVLIPGDLTAAGYEDQYVEAKEYLDRLDCEDCVVIAGNHDCRNVGYLHFEEIFGRRYHDREYPFGLDEDGGTQRSIKIVAADSNKPDLNDGELGRDKYGWIQEQFADPDPFKVFMLHHHLVPIPGTGRERNILTDAGDVLAVLVEAGVDLVLAGHKHVPYVWKVANTLIVTSGTAATWRTRGDTPPSYNTIEITPSTVEISIRHLDRDAIDTRIFERE